MKCDNDEYSVLKWVIFDAVCDELSDKLAKRISVENLTNEINVFIDAIKAYSGEE